MKNTVFEDQANDGAWDVTINGKWRASFRLESHANNWASQFNLLDVEIVQRSNAQKPNFDTRDCIVCHERIAPNYGICFKCHNETSA